MRLRAIMIFHLLLFVLLSGCSSHDKVLEENRKLKEEISTNKLKINALMEEVDKFEKQSSPKPISMTFRQPPYKKRFVEKELKIYAMPTIDAPKLNTIEKNTVVIVNDLVSSVDGELWIYVTIPVYSGPDNMKGWIKESDTEPYTKEKQALVQADIVIKANSPVFETYDFNRVSSIQPTLYDYDLRGRINQKMNGYVMVDCPGGMTICVEEKYVSYPDVE